jgi:hypothetical protein
MGEADNYDATTIQDFGYDFNKGNAAQEIIFCLTKGLVTTNI